MYDLEPMNAIAEKMNRLGAQRIPFLFVIGYDNGKHLVIPLSELDADELLYSIGGFSNFNDEIPVYFPQPVVFDSFPVSYETYKIAFDNLFSGIQYGNSYLANLTFATPINTNLTLPEIFARSTSPYRLCLRNQFTCFSPECFVKIAGGKIFSFPMKGTIAAGTEEAKEKLLADIKENAEHTTIVDLIRNDLAMVAENIRVNRFKYIDLIKTSKIPLYQMSSEISGDLPVNYHQIIGNIIFTLLPAGSVTGAPKKKTVEMIKEAEISPRGWYTGIAGIFDGINLDSCVLIRLIEQTPDGLLFHSGGGITFMSQPEYEYREMIEKIYLPFAL